MSSDQLQAFLALVAADPTLQRQLEDAEPAAIVERAQQAGYTITLEELLSAQSELTDDDVGDLAGGVGLSLPVEAQSPTLQASQFSTTTKLTPEMS